MNRKIVVTGAVFVLLAIVLGAFGAHSLKEIISSERLTSFETGVRYQMYHGLSLLLLGTNADRLLNRGRWVIICLVSGSVLFSGSIYLLALQEPLQASLGFLGPITPIGGSVLIAGWIIFIVQLIRK